MWLSIYCPGSVLYLRLTAVCLNAAFRRKQIAIHNRLRWLDLTSSDLGLQWLQSFTDCSINKMPMFLMAKIKLYPDSNTPKRIPFQHLSAKHNSLMSENINCKRWNLVILCDNLPTVFCTRSANPKLNDSCRTCFYSLEFLIPIDLTGIPSSKHVIWKVSDLKRAMNQSAGGRLWKRVIGGIYGTIKMQSDG